MRMRVRARWQAPRNENNRKVERDMPEVRTPHEVTDETGEETTVHWIKGYDAHNPDSVYPCRYEMWPGGRLVARHHNTQITTIAADPTPPPDEAEVSEQRRVRGEEARQVEAEARRDELERREDEVQRQTEKERIDLEARAQLDARRAARSTEKPGKPAATEQTALDADKSGEKVGA